MIKSLEKPRFCWHFTKVIDRFFRISCKCIRFNFIHVNLNGVRSVQISDIKVTFIIIHLFCTMHFFNNYITTKTWYQNWYNIHVWHIFSNVFIFPLFQGCSMHIDLEQLHEYVCWICNLFRDWIHGTWATTSG